MGELSVIDDTGDTKYIWDSSVPEEVTAARNHFNELLAKNYLAYTVEEDGSKGKVIKEFDPSLGKIIMAPPVVGG